MNTDDTDLHGKGKRFGRVCGIARVVGIKNKVRQCGMGKEF